MIVVTGATGTVGRQVVQLLLDEDTKVAAVTRHPAAAGLPEGVQIVSGDPSRPSTLASAVADVEAVLLSPRATGEAAAGLLSLAASHGAQRVVVLSAATVAFPAGDPRFAEHFRAVEQAALDSGLAATVLRCSDFDANALAWVPQIRAGDIVRGAYPAAATSPIHERDIAEVAVRALTRPEPGCHVLTGPQSLTQPDKVRLMGEAVGRNLEFAEVTPEQARRGMLAQGLPGEIPDRLLGSLRDYAAQPGPTTGTVQELLGRPALTFAEWARQNAASWA
jgi:uncharacterized protein YbjT (DUF2867 family)